MVDAPTYVYKPTWVANTFLWKDKEEGVGIDPLKIQKLVFAAVWECYKSFSGAQLSALTLADGTPWSRARAEARQYISDDEIKAHFIELARQPA